MSSNDQRSRNPADALEALAGELRGLRPDDGFSDAVMNAVDAQATPALDALAPDLRGLRPDDGFSDAVMAAIEEAPLLVAVPASDMPANDMPANDTPANDGGWSEGVWRSGVPALVLAAVAAAATLLLSISAQDELDADVLATVDVVEVVE